MTRTEQRANENGSAIFDCAVVGAGPAGLTAALYLARFNRSVVLYDAGNSRARWIPESNNCPGFPGGISGNHLLERLRRQVSAHPLDIRGVRVDEGRVTSDGFDLTGSNGATVHARTVLLATGIVDVLPDVPWAHAAIDAGAMRLCPVCDGYEARDLKIAVYGRGTAALDHALFIRAFSSDVTLVCSDGAPLQPQDLRRAATAGIAVLSEPGALSFDGRKCSFAAPEGGVRTFDTVYAFLGCEPQSQLARRLGAACDEEGALRVGPHQMTSVPGLYAAGDVVSALNQISVAVGQAGIAASAIHSRLPLNLRTPG